MDSLKTGELAVIVIGGVFILVYFIFSLLKAMSGEKDRKANTASLTISAYQFYELLIKAAIVLSIFGTLYLIFLFFTQNMDLLKLYTGATDLKITYLMRQILEINTKSAYFWPAFPVLIVTFVIILLTSRTIIKHILKPLGLWEENRYQISSNSPFASTSYWTFEFLLKAAISISIIGSFYLFYLTIIFDLDLVYIYSSAMKLNSGQISGQLGLNGRYFWPSFPILLVVLLSVLLISRKLKDQVHGSLKPFTNRAKQASKRKRKSSPGQNKKSEVIANMASSVRSFKGQLSGSIGSVAKKTKKASSNAQQRIKKSTPVSKPKKAAPKARKVNNQSDSSDGNLFSILCHLSSFFGLGIILPIIVLYTKGKESEYVSYHAKEVLNFQISVLFYWILGFIFLLLTVGTSLVAAFSGNAGASLMSIIGLYLFLFAFGFYLLIIVIIGTIKASNGVYFRYPFILRLIK
jgi:uncharacterized protein